MRLRRCAMIVLVLLIAPGATPALAHEGGGAVGGFLSGLAHPIFGWDHVVAMVAVGLWGAFPRRAGDLAAAGGLSAGDGARRRARHPGRASAGGRDRHRGLCGGARPRGRVPGPAAPLVAAVVVGGFAIFHGHAHGTELPHAANPLTYAIEFVLATGLLHLFGIVFGLLARWPVGRLAVRAGDAAIALVGVAFLTGIT